MCWWSILLPWKTTGRIHSNYSVSIRKPNSLPTVAFRRCLMGVNNTRTRKNLIWSSWMKLTDSVATAPASMTNCRRFASRLASMPVCWRVHKRKWCFFRPLRWTTVPMTCRTCCSCSRIVRIAPSMASPIWRLSSPLWFSNTTNWWRNVTSAMLPPKLIESMNRFATRW